MSDSGLEIEIDCPRCPEKHVVPLDASGHYSGPLPCDQTIRIELQIKPDEWRATMDDEREKIQH